MIGKLIREYRVITELGSGGMGTVYFAEHTVIGRRAAIKVLNPDVSGNQEIVARFFTEAKAVNSIRHPNIVDITDFGEVDSIYFIVMEMLEGETLGARMEGSVPIGEKATVRILSQVASAVGAVNEHGIVHRDLKPENIFLTNHPDYPDFVKVLDFGVVKLMGAPAEGAARTRAGAAIGTPAYMSPEQCLGDARLDHRSDIYSLGVVGYEMLTGGLPFVGDSLEVMMGHARGVLVPPKERYPALSDRLNDVIVRALAKKPEARFDSMREMRLALEAAVGPVHARPTPPAEAAPAPLPAAAASAAAAAAVAVAVAVAKGAPERAPATREPAPADPALAGEESARVERMEKAQTKKVGGKLREIIARRIAQNRLAVPSMPAVAVKCLELLRDKNARFSDLAATVERDPLIAARLLRVVNSPAYGGREPITSIENAISRLGMKPFRVIMIELAAREVFVSKSQRIRQAFRGIWEHCLAVGMLARDVAARLPGAADGETAYLAGLFHDVGKPVVGSLLLEAERSLIEELDEPFMTDTLWIRVVDDAHRDVGAALASQWNLPAAVAKAIAGCDAYEPGAGRASCTNLVRYANALTKRQGIYVGAVDAEEVAAIATEGRRILNLDEGTESLLVTGLGERVHSITAAGAGPPKTVAPARA
jgi:putative nucleotidyltransferase with HDIG domain